jgi:LuxR family transcriptional regulator, maltose regulon positive regulatory protein
MTAMTNEPTAAVACAVLGGAMAAEGRLEEAWRWLGLAERALQPEAEPGIGTEEARYAGLISDILDLLTQPSQAASPEPARPSQPASLELARLREPLTETEIRVLPYLLTHLRAPEIADELALSVNTVKTHLRHLYQKLGAHSRREAGQRARAFGLLGSSPMRPTATKNEAIQAI